MAINKITTPGSDTPANFWPGVINELNLLKMFINPSEKIVNGYVKKGFIVNIGGVFFAADVDTAINGTENGSVAVKFVVSGSTATATYVSSTSGVTWNDAYNGFYDVDGNLYIKDYIYPGNKLINIVNECGYIASKTYVETVSIIIPRSGMWRIKYVMEAVNQGDKYYENWAILYKNGSAVGTEHNINNVHSAPKAGVYDDFYFDKGDLCSIYTKGEYHDSSSDPESSYIANGTSIRNFGLGNALIGMIINDN